MRIKSILSVSLFNVIIIMLYYIIIIMKIILQLTYMYVYLNRFNCVFINYTAFTDELIEMVFISDLFYGFQYYVEKI